MQPLLFVALAAISTELGSVSHAAGIQPPPQLVFVLQTSASGTAIGSAVAARAKRRNPDAGTWAITTAWATMGSALGCLAAVAEAL